MKRSAATAIFILLPALAGAEELPMKRVVLSTSGLAQFTHYGEVPANATLELPVRLDQADDILKSLTIFDGAGSIGAVSLPGKAPLTELFRDLPFGQEALDSPVELLNALTGAEAEIDGEVNAKGRIFRIEEEHVQLPNNGGETVRHRLTLLTERGFVQAVLENVRSLRLTDPQLRAQIDRALAGVALNRIKDQRTVSITLTGQGPRQAGFSYVVAAPVWKTAYRLVFPKDGGKARLQGWGILENLTGGDWKDIELTLVSGNPVALKQALYSAVYADRPEIPVPASVRLVPRRDGQESAVIGALISKDKPYLSALPAFRSGAPSDSPAPPVAARGLNAKEMAPAASAPESEEAATQVLYRFPSRVTLASGATMMVPFVDREFSASRTYLYQPDVNSRHPLASVHLLNDGDAALPAGLLTAFETGGDGFANFAGDAELPLISRGGSRFVTFALDARTDIRRADRGVKQTRLGKAVNGELKTTVKSLWTIDYEITPPADEDREIIIEEARQDGWTSASDVKGLEDTPSRTRLTTAAPKGKTTKLSLTREHVDYESAVLTSLGPDRILAVISGLQNQAPALKDAIAKLGELTASIGKAGGRRRELDAERKKIADDQDRIRKNLASAGQSSDLGKRYIDALKAGEDRLEAISAEEAKIEAAVAAKTKEAEAVAQALSL
jgi:hypothetical protein